MAGEQGDAAADESRNTLAVQHLDEPPNARDIDATIADIAAQQHLVELAFDKAWRFVKHDPFLAHNPASVLRERLQVHLANLAKIGAHDLFELANLGIGRVRSELSAAARPGARAWKCLGL
jgi:uncharacterized protein YlxP (DUF503 family)